MVYLFVKKTTRNKYTEEIDKHMATIFCVRVHLITFYTCFWCKLHCILS